MRITDVYLQGIGPFPGRREVFCLHTDDSRVLLTGISGSGKSTALWAMAFLWRLLDPRGAPQVGAAPQGDLAMHIRDLPGGDVLVACVRAGEESFLAAAARRHPGARLVRAGGELPPAFGEARREDFPNMLLLDADARFPRRPENLESAWFLTDDDVRDLWPQAMADLNAAGSPRVKAALQGINRLLVDKELLFSPGGDLQVRLKGEVRHGPGQLSMGERHIAILCFCAACCLRPGGVLLLDEPAVHLHPSQIMGLLTTLEGYCRQAKGQLFLVSHNPAIWQRYEELGLSVELEVRHGDA